MITELYKYEKLKLIETVFLKQMRNTFFLWDGTSPCFDVKHGIRQGFHLSYFWELPNFLIYLLLTVNVEGIKIGDNVLTISQLADDTCFFKMNFKSLLL